MNQDIFAGQWKQMRGALKSWWGKLADDDVERIFSLFSHLREFSNTLRLSAKEFLGMVFSFTVPEK